MIVTVDKVFWELIFILPFFFFLSLKQNSVWLYFVFKNSNFLLLLALHIEMLMEKQGY